MSDSSFDTNVQDVRVVSRRQQSAHQQRDTRGKWDVRGNGVDVRKAVVVVVTYGPLLVVVASGERERAAPLVFQLRVERVPHGVVDLREGQRHERVAGVGR